MNTLNDCATAYALFPGIAVPCGLLTCVGYVRSVMSAPVMRIGTGLPTRVLSNVKVPASRTEFFSVRATPLTVVPILFPGAL